MTDKAINLFTLSLSTEVDILTYLSPVKSLEKMEYFIKVELFGALQLFLKF